MKKDKLEAEELSQLQELQSTFQGYKMQLGELELQKSMLLKEVDDVKEDFNKLEGSVPQEKSNGLLARSANSSKTSGVDYSNPAVRIAKQMQLIRKYRDDINGTK